MFLGTVSCPISGHFLQNCNILPQNSTNELKFSHNVASTVGREVSSPKALWFLCNYGKSRSVKFCALIPDNCVLTVINASAAVTLLEQKPEKIQALSGFCSSSVTAALALMTVSTQLLLMDKINFTVSTVKCFVKLNKI